MSTNHHRTTSKPGFTLIELLVVISIISMLIAILLPSLAAARKAAQAIQCANSQRQLGMSMTMYIESYKRWYPPRLWRSNASPPQWYNPNPAMHGSYWFTLLNASIKNEGLSTTNGDGKFFRCASDQNFLWATSTNRLSYGYNYYGPTTAPFKGVANNNEKNFKAPSETIVLGDSIYYDVIIPLGAATTSIGNRHNGDANILWADGHVSRKPYEDVNTTAAWWTIMAD